MEFGVGGQLDFDALKKKNYPLGLQKR